MANPTTNYGWPMPTTTDLVTDLPADFAAFGQPVDTSLKALNPETTLGDIAYRSSTSNTNTRLGIGSTGQVLTDASGVPSWATPTVTTSKVVQMVNTQTGTMATGSGNIPADNTIPQNTEGDQYMSLAITPTSASSVLLIDVFAISAAGNDTFQSAALFQDSTAGALASIAGLIAGTDKVYTFAFRHKMTAGTTSATTFKVRIGGNAGTTTFNGRAAGQLLGGTLASSITVTEYTP